MLTMLSHLPVNHPLRPLYRVLAGLVGGYTLVFGFVGFAQTRGTALFAQHGLPYALGLRTNLAFAMLSVVAGVVLLGAALIGRNLDYLVNFFGGLVFMLVGMVALALLQTDLNYLGFTVSTCVVSFILGTVVFTAGLYGRSRVVSAPRSA
jgi:hypothetical protein